MINIYYTYASGSSPSIASVIPDTSKDIPTTYYDVTLEITASAYETSGSTFNSTVGDLRVYIKSGSYVFASFPSDTTNIYYDESSSLAPFSSSYISLSSIFTLYGVNNIDSASCIFNISSSGFTASFSGSDFSGSSNYAAGLAIYPNYTYTFTVNPTGSLYPYLQIYDTTNGPVFPFYPGTLLVDISGSMGVNISSSLYLSSSHNYLISALISKTLI